MWCKANDCAENEALIAERRSMTDALKHINELDLRGGVLHVNGEIVAFTFGAPINNETFDTCVEKANTDIEGAYAMINNEFANSTFISTVRKTWGWKDCVRLNCLIIQKLFLKNISWNYNERKRTSQATLGNLLQ